MTPTDTIGSEVKLYHGDCLSVLPSLPAGSVDAVVTSPPYWGGVRDYGHPSQMGHEGTPAEYATRLREVFALVRPALAADGAVWLNIGDVYAASGKGGGGSCGSRACWQTTAGRTGSHQPPPGYKRKDLSLCPFLVADALRADGWYLRQVVVWEKTSAVEPERADRPSVSHEYVFLLAKSEQYATADPGEKWWSSSVWRIASAASGSDQGHPATMPFELARRCVVASTRPGGTVLDPFAGSGTTGRAALRLGRKFIGVELADAHYATALRRLKHAAGVGADQLFSHTGEGASDDR